MPDKVAIQIPEGFVPMQYSMDRKTEIEITGGRLKVGMVIIAKIGHRRGNPDLMAKKQYATQQFLLHNARWCRIISLSRNGTYAITFEGVYADGDSFIRQTNPDTTWIVKKSSIPK